jgi:hypothetical protein
LTFQEIPDSKYLGLVQYSFGACLHLAKAKNIFIEKAKRVLNASV